MSEPKNSTKRRIDFASAHTQPIANTPDLLEVQLKSFRDFFQLDTPPEQRSKEGLYKVFAENFPISDPKGKFTLEFVDYVLDAPKYTHQECVRRGVTYAVPLKASLKLLRKEDEGDGFEAIEQDVFLGNIPYMTPKGSFVINGAERVVVSQIHRSPGVFFGQSTHASGAKLYSARVIPFKGSWIEFTTDVSNVMYVYIDRKKKFPITTLLRAIGYGSDSQILDLFGLSEEVKVSQATLKQNAGRKLAARILKTWTEDFVDEDATEVISVERNEILLERDTLLTEEAIETILASEAKSIVFYKQDVSISDYDILYNTFHKDNTNSEREAVEQLYRQVRGGEPPDEQTARETVQSLLFSTKRYNLGEVGRYRINKKLGLDISVGTTVLTKEDIVEIVKHLVKLVKEKATADDIDHLSNRRVRTVGEQLYAQFGVGLSRMSRTIREQMSIKDHESFKPADLINARTITSLVNSFFGTNPLSQFMDQVNPLSEVTHKRRVSALGPGGLPRDRATFEARDIHYTYAGRLCAIETPEGPNIGLISHLCIHARVNPMGFIETPYRESIEGRVDFASPVKYLTAEEEDGCNIAQASVQLNEDGTFAENKVKVRSAGDFPLVTPQEISYVDVAPNQIVSVASALIPFLEHNDATRALMGSNMQRQAVPLIKPQAPIVGTGMEARVAREFGGLIEAEADGTVRYVDAKTVQVEYDFSERQALLTLEDRVRTYELCKFQRTNQDTCVNLRPVVQPGQKVYKGQLLCEGYAVQASELALGNNLRVAFMSWKGYNYEDAIVISERVVQEDLFTSIHIEEFSVEVRSTKLGKEEFTSSIPNVSEEAVGHLDEHGIVQVGTEVNEGDILVGKIIPRGETDLTAEEKLLHAIFGDKARNVRDASLRVPPSMKGVVVDTQLFKRSERSAQDKKRIEQELNRLKDAHAKRLLALRRAVIDKLSTLLQGQTSQGIYHKFGHVILDQGKPFTPSTIEKKLFPSKNPYRDENTYNVREETHLIGDLTLDHWTGDAQKDADVRQLLESYNKKRNELIGDFRKQKSELEVGDELPTGVLQLAKVYVAKKRKLKVGDKMAGRHGNKGIVSKIVRREDMPFMADGTPVDIVLSPLGIPSRMNIGQLFETVLGWAGLTQSVKYASPIFDGASIQDIEAELEKAKLPRWGQTDLYDGLTGEKFSHKVTTGVIYMLKLAHLVDDKMHARSTGPYSLITQQPLGGKSQHGGQRLGEMEVWAKQAYGAAHSLREMMTIKSDDVSGRSETYAAIVKGESIPTPRPPESFNVLLHEMRGIGLNVELRDQKEELKLLDTQEAPVHPLHKDRKAVQQFSEIIISLSSPESILERSCGEVTQPETVNYRTHKPEMKGLFCERIFGPTKDWECHCGKYKRIRYKNVTCDRCGVTVTEKKVRRVRMGHIKLAAPVAHVWYFRSLPNKIGCLLGLPTKKLDQVIYYERYVVIQPGLSADHGVVRLDLLSEEEYLAVLDQLPPNNDLLHDEDPNKFIAKMGAEALHMLLSQVQLDELSFDLRHQANHDTSRQRRAEALKRLRIVEAFRDANTRIENRPEWMVMQVIPVIPPELRPLVPLDGGRFATSDLNDLYRRVIIRNDRLKRLMATQAPDVIVRSEKRMLQEAVDSLFDNSRRVNAVASEGIRPLKSLSDILKGKQGRFRQNLLGKRVDYSGRSVIVVGPDLKLSECGLPKAMAAELFKPFIVRRLLDRGIVKTVKSAKRLIEKKVPEVWDILESVLEGHPVLLNRAPTLHRLGMQAFQPKLIEGKAIQLHPLVCSAFNADFDGDTMAVHVPLSQEAIAEASLLMLSSYNILNPGSGSPVTVPSKDMVLGLYYLTKVRESSPEAPVLGEGMTFYGPEEVEVAVDMGKLSLHAKIKVRMPIRDASASSAPAKSHQTLETTAGRVIFNQRLPKEIPFINETLTGKKLQTLTADVYRYTGTVRTAQFLDDIKAQGFHWAYKGGMTLAIEDVKVPEQKSRLIAKAKEEVEAVWNHYRQGLITDRERYNQVIDVWTRVNTKITNLLMKQLQDDQQGFNSVYMMLHSGARGSREQVRQLGGIRGLMAKPQKSLHSSIGGIIENPILSNFKEGLDSIEYFISAHGARKGLADMALKTADAGYLTRRLVDVAQDVVITEQDCGTCRGISVSALRENEDVIETLSYRALGRTAAEDVYCPKSNALLLETGQEVTEAKAELIEAAGIEKLKLRSPLTCQTERGLCIKCYGRNLATGHKVQVGEAVGVIAAQSIGEPGTQLTMRTFHVGGVAANIASEAKIEARYSGVIEFEQLNSIPLPQDEETCQVVVSRSCEIRVLDPASAKVLMTDHVPYGAHLRVRSGDSVEVGQELCHWDPYNAVILSSVSGTVRFDAIEEGITCQKEYDEQTGYTQNVIIDTKDKTKNPCLIVETSDNNPLFYNLPVQARIAVEEGESVYAGQVLAKVPRMLAKSRDITGGLPRVTELFEARNPSNMAVVSEITGAVSYGGVKRASREIFVESKDGVRKKYLVSLSRHILVQENDYVKAGTPLSEGVVSPADILAIKGPVALQKYLVNELQDVYRLQGVSINDKHLEIIVRQMMSKVEVVEAGDTTFSGGQVVDQFFFREENDKLLNLKVIVDAGDSQKLRAGQMVNARELTEEREEMERQGLKGPSARNAVPATCKVKLQGITQASLGTESFISAAAFQETTKVLSEAAISGKRDALRGLKENVIVGRLIPAGTGMKAHVSATVVHEDEIEPAQVEEEQMFSR